MSKGLIVSVGAGYPQTPFIKRLKEKGFSVAAFGVGRNDPEAIKICDYFQEISTSDYQSAISWIESLPEKIIGAGSFAGGVAIDTLQKIERYFNLPTQTPEFLSVGMDKHQQQKLYTSLNLSQIETFKISELLSDSSKIKLESNYILKPVIGRGSSGVHKLNGKELLHWLETKDLNDNDLVQEFITGVEYRLMVIIQDSRLKLLAQVKRDSLENTFLLGRLTIVNSHKDQLKTYMNGMIESTGIKNAIIKLDVIINADSINMIEMDIGVGGGLYYKKFIESAYNINIIDEYIHLITNQPLSFDEDINPKDNILMDYIYNYHQQPISYSIDTMHKLLDKEVGPHKVIENLLSPADSGKFETNADFIFTVIHQKPELSTFALNHKINEHFSLL